jgi:hypothetical protein
MLKIHHLLTILLHFVILYTLGVFIQQCVILHNGVSLLNYAFGNFILIISNSHVGVFTVWKFSNSENQAYFPWKPVLSHYQYSTEQMSPWDYITAG